MTQGALTVLLVVLVVAVGLATARIQSENTARAGRLHELEEDTEWMRRGLGEIEASLARDAFRAEDAITDEFGGPIPYDAHELSRETLEVELPSDPDAAIRQVHAEAVLVADEARSPDA